MYPLFRRTQLASLCLGAVVWAGCGTVDGTTADDQPGPDPAIPGTVHVTVLDPSGTGSPAVGASVVFVGPDGTLVKRTATDTAGQTAADVLPGSSVTAITLAGAAYQLQTVLEAKPGDDLVIGTKNLDATVVGTFAVKFSTFPTATTFTALGPCGGNTVGPIMGTANISLPISMYAYCKQDTMEIMVIGQDDAGNVIAVLDQTNVPYVNNGSVTMPAQAVANRDFTGSYTNINPIIMTLTTTRAVPDSSGVSTSRAIQTPAATATMTFSGPVGATASVDTTVTSTTRSVQNVRQSIAGGAVSYGLDVGGTLLPWLATPSYDAATGTLRVPVDTTGTSTAKPDAFRITASYRRTDATATTLFTWTLYASAPADIKLPALPQELANLAPTTTDTVAANALMLEADTLAGYDAIRNNLGATFALYSSNNRSPATTVRLSRSQAIKAP